jgi:hypothetical protein
MRKLGLEELREAFNGAGDCVRLLSIVSPT